MRRITKVLVLAWVAAIAIGAARPAAATLPAPNHPLFFGYWHAASAADGQIFNCDYYYSWEPTVWWCDASGVWGYKTIINHDQVYAIPRGSFDYFPETLSFTNGYVSESRDTIDLSPAGTGGQDAHLIWEALWVARQVETMERAAVAGKDIYWEVRMPFLGITGALAKIIVAIRDHDTAHPEAQIWPRVKWIDVADSPAPGTWTASYISGHITTMVNKLTQYGLPTAGKLFGITVGDAGFPAAKASTADFVQFNACIDAPATGQQGDVAQWSTALQTRLNNYIGQLTAAGKKTFLRLQGFDGGGCWHDMNTVAELNRVAYRRAATDANVLGLTVWNWAAGGPTAPGTLCPSGESAAAFAWGSRPDGPRNQAPYSRTELRSVHQEIWQAIAGSLDTTPPASVTGFAAVPGTNQVNLTWTNPSDSDYTGCMIRAKTTGYPTGPIDGTLVIDKPGSPCAADGYIHRGLTAGTTRYYGAFAHDGVPNYADRADASATPRDAPGVCFSDGFSYPDGNLGGNGSWSGAFPPIVVSAGTVKITGGSPEYNTVRTVSCSGAGGLINVRVLVKGSPGSATMWSLWIDDPGGNNLARWYGSSMSARPRIGGSNSLVLNPVSLTGGWDILEVNINTLTNVDEFFVNGMSLGTLDHTSTGASDAVGRLTWQRIDNSLATTSIYFDDLSVGNVDSTPPGPVTGLKAAPGDGRVALSWANPTDSDFAGTKILYKTTDYPTSKTDGTVVYTGAGTSCVHTGLANGTRCYYSAFAYDGFPNYSPAASARTTPAAEATIPQAKALEDGQKRLLRGDIVSATYAGFFYVQEPDRQAGLMVIAPDSVGLGDVVDVVGAMGGSGSQRYIDTGGDPVIVTAPGP